MRPTPKVMCLLLAGVTLFGWTSKLDGQASEKVANGPDYSKAMREVEKDLAEVLEELAAQRSEIAEERPSLAKKTNEVAAELREKRRRAKLAEQDRDALLHEMESLSGRVREFRDEQVYVESLLADFRKQMEADMGVAEGNAFRNQFSAADQEGDSGLLALLELAESASDRLPNLKGVRTIQGEALDANGVAKAGQFVEAGPVRWFISDDGTTAGLVVLNRALQAEVVPGVGEAGAIADLAAGQGGAPEFDPTLGTAVALGTAEGNWIDHIRKGGFWIYPILLLALIATVAALAKWLQLAGIRELKPPVVTRVLKAVNSGNRKRARAELEGARHPSVAVLERGIEVGGKASRDDVEEALYEKYLEAQPALKRGLPLIAIASATAPLLGLLGTVTGMIQTFKLINIFGTGNAKTLSSGISEALVTTEFGLVVAIPALILHALLSRKVQGIKASMEMTSLAFLNGLKVERSAA